MLWSVCYKLHFESFITNYNLVDSIAVEAALLQKLRAKRPRNVGPEQQVWICSLRVTWLSLPAAEVPTFSSFQSPHSPELLQVQEVLEVSLLDSADGVPVQVQELQIGQNTQGVPRNGPADGAPPRVTAKGRAVAGVGPRGGAEENQPEAVVIEGEALQIVQPQEGGGRDGGQAHPGQHQAVEAGQRQEVLLLQAQDGVLTDHQDLQRGQRLEPAAVDGHQPVGVEVESGGRETE